MSDEILDEQQVAAMLDCATSTVLELARERKIPGVKLGKSWRFPRAALMEVLNRMAMATTEKPARKATMRKPAPRPIPAIPDLRQAGR